MKNEIVIVVEGGCITSILTNGQEITVSVIDYDTEICDPEGSDTIDVPQTDNNKTAEAYFYQGVLTETNPQRISLINNLIKEKQS